MGLFSHHVGRPHVDDPSQPEQVPGEAERHCPLVGTGQPEEQALLQVLHPRQLEAIGLERAEDGAVLSTKLKTKKSPKGMFKKVTLKRDFRRVAKSIKGACASYRPDLEKDALARWTVIHRSLGEKKKSAPVKKSRRGNK